MARRFVDARSLFDDLLDRHEAGAESPIAYLDYDGFRSVAEADDCIRELRELERAGAVRLGQGRGSQRDHIAHVRLSIADALYRHVGRRPAAELATKAHSDLVDELQLHPALVAAAGDVRGRWTRAAAWHGFGPSEGAKLKDAFRLAQAVIDGLHTGSDYRTFSRRITGDSKALERVEGAVVRLISGVLDVPPSARPREALRALGLEKFAPPLLIAGPVALGDADMSRSPSPYVGLPPREAGLLRLVGPPSYLLTIENFASFNRHAIEADPQRSGITIYVGGYPSLATQEALRTIASLVPDDVPLRHWSDIDPDGMWIFHTIERSLPRPLKPHLMNRELAERFGRAPLKRSSFRTPPAGSGISELAQYLLSADAKYLEQEELDPAIPD